ncbi:MAG: hypothetical protein J7L92_06465 [Dehalococcoidia bacterium]|nr:hypothetical protein [Dehalococcoidia bacterium]
MKDSQFTHCSPGQTAETGGLRHREFRGVRQENLLCVILTSRLSWAAMLALITRAKQPLGIAQHCVDNVAVQ